MKVRLRVLYSVCALILLSSMILQPAMVSAVHLSRPLLAVWPSLNIHEVGTTFEVSINLTEVDSLQAYNIALSYNTLVLDATEATLTGTWPETEGRTYEVEIFDVNDGLGRVNFEVFIVDEPLTGSGILLFVKFVVATGGSTLLNLDETQNLLVNSNFDTIQHDTSDGVFTTIGPGLTIPQPFFTYSPSNPIIGGSVFFDASGSFSPNGEITTYTWDFGDGTRMSTGLTFASHVFQNLVGEPVSGTFNVTLGVVDVVEQTNSTFQLVTIKPLSAGQPPIARFFSSPIDPVVGEVTIFNATVSVDPDGGSVVDAAWDFGDGATAPGLVATHAYSSAGFFNLQLAVFDEEGQNGTLRLFIGVAKAEVQLLDTYAGARVLSVRDGSVQTLFVDIINTGGRTLNVYAIFEVTYRRGGSSVILSGVVQLDVREESSISVLYSPPVSGHYSVRVTVLFNLRSTSPVDPRWVLGPDGAFGFNVVGLRPMSQQPFESEPSIQDQSKHGQP